jgi:hypothetical protein
VQKTRCKRKSRLEPPANRSSSWLGAFKAVPMEQTDGERLDIATAIASVGDYSLMEAVEPIDRAASGRRSDSR